jgi:hypothetical protein
MHDILVRRKAERLGDTDREGDHIRFRHHRLALVSGGEVVGIEVHHEENHFPFGPDLFDVNDVGMS